LQVRRGYVFTFLVQTMHSAIHRSRHTEVPLSLFLIVVDTSPYDMCAGRLSLSPHASPTTGSTTQSGCTCIHGLGHGGSPASVASALFLDFATKSSVFVCDEVTRINPCVLATLGARWLPKFISLTVKTLKHIIPHKGDLWRIIQELQRHTNTLTPDGLRILCVWSVVSLTLPTFALFIRQGSVSCMWVSCISGRSVCCSHQKA
jgi:hypothetical protein